MQRGFDLQGFTQIKRNAVLRHGLEARQFKADLVLPRRDLGNAKGPVMSAHDLDLLSTLVFRVPLWGENDMDSTQWRALRTLNRAQ